ncbi:QWxxN domain [Enterococcus mundtii]|uniref:Uncharacterized protein n=1 Tax=Enterococcus mundtii TaxID=53346 RepID=A0A2S7RSG0_ENTMU|nr:QWxxN domain [Enterococcus mundtii]PQF22577.1 hypothetical protein CUS89_10625 [Enterococcus mundtii]
MPIDNQSNRQRNGQFNNKKNDKEDKEALQEAVNAISSGVGRAPTSEILRSPFLLSLYVSSILGNVVIRGERPNQQQIIRNSGAVFEADTFVEVTQHANQTEVLNSLTSHSTVNTTLLTPALTENTTAIATLDTPSFPFFYDNTTYNLTDFAHHWSLNIHKIAHGIAKTYGCTTNKTITDVPKLWGWQTTSNHTKVHFKTVCQSAIAESQKMNDRRTDNPAELHHFSFKKGGEGSSKQQFSFEDSAEKLRNIFQQSFNNATNQMNQQTTGNAKNDIPESANFFAGLTEAFITFFNDFDHPTYTERQESLKGDSLITRFLSMMAQSITYQEKIHDTVKPSNSTNVPHSFQSSDLPSGFPTLKKEEAGFATQFWTLFSKMDETLTNYIKKWDLFVVRGADARPINDPRLNARAESEGETVKDNQRGKKVAKKPQSSMIEIVKGIVEDIEHNRTPTSRYQEPLPYFFYDKFLFRSKSETKNVIKKLKIFLIKQKAVSKNANDLEVVKAFESWAKIRRMSDISQDSSKVQFAAYLIRRNYGLKNVRIGDALTTEQLQAIFMQLKVNVHLVNYTYQEKSKPIQMSPAEKPVEAYYRKETNVCNQIFSDFINDVPATVPKNQTNTAVIYNRDLFDNREKTEAVNKQLIDFAQKQGFILKNPTASELVRWMRMWLFRLGKYEEIVSREELVAKELLRAYGSKMTLAGTNDSRAVILQWENNNAQMGYRYAKNNIDAIAPDARKDKSDQTEEEQVQSFLQENHIIPKNETLHGVEQPADQSRRSEPVEVIDQRICQFLKTKGVVCNLSNPQVLVDTVSNWLLLEGAVQKVIDPVKLKQIAQTILNQEDNGLISNKEAELTFANWLEGKLAKKELSDLPDNQPKTDKPDLKPDNQPKTDKPDLKNDEIQWRSQQVTNKVEQYLRQNYLITGPATKENILSGIGKWFMQNRDEREIRSERLQAIATVILKELNLYGGAEDELISDNDAKKTVMKWVMENVLGSSVEEYATKKILDHPNPATFTIGELRDSFKLKELVKNKRIILNKNNDAKKQKELETNIGYLWKECLNYLLPNYFLKSSELSDDLLISDYGSLMQIAGSRILAASGLLNKFDKEEIRTLGELFFESVSEKGVQDIEEFDQLLLPALFTTAQLDAPSLKIAIETGNYREFAISTFIGYFQRGYFTIMAHEEEFNRFYRNYKTAVINFRRKQALVGEVLNECERLGIRVPPAAGEIYLAGGNPCPGPWIPPNIETWYRELTSDVAESYHLLNRKLIGLSIDSFSQTELDFMFSPETRIYEGTAEFRDEAALASNPIGSIPSLVIASRKENRDDLILRLKQTDILVAIRGNEERVYALKRLEKEGGYTIYRVDKDPLLFLDHDLIDLKSLWWKKYKKEGAKIRIGDYSYTFVMQTHQDKQLSHGDERESLFNNISTKHKDILYQQLYESGNDQTMASKVWDAVSHFIPFYDCVVGIINKDVESAVPNCVIDALLVIPVLGQIATINIRFALGAARVIAKSGVTGLVRNSAKVLPKLSDLRSLLASVVRYIDPGIEAAISGGRFVIKNLLKLKDQPILTRNIHYKPVLTKLEKHEKDLPAPVISKMTVTAHLPRNGPQVLVKKMKNNLYVKVSDFKKGDVYGKVFTLRGEELREFEGPIFFSQKQKEIINSLKINIQPDEMFIEKKNFYPKGYGEGTVMEIYKNGQKKMDVIEMDDQLVPVRIQAIKKYGVRYDVMNGDKVLPVNFNGIEWYFEPNTSPIISRAVKIEVTNRINQFEAIWDPSTLSAPDGNGLMWSAEGRSYIKIQERYIPLALLDKENNRYHLVKKDILEPMTVLRLDPGIDQFRFETQLEKSVVERPDDLLFAGGFDEGASTSRGGTVPTQNQLTSRPLSNPKYPPYMWIPKIPEKWQEWKARMNAIEIAGPSGFSVVEDSRVVLPPLTKLIPEPPKQISTNEAMTIKKIKMGIQHCLPDELKNKYRVFAGLDAAKMPEHLIEFRKVVAKEYKEALIILDHVIEECTYMLRSEKISSTKRGTYLANMFNVYGKAEEQAVLKEVVKRLKSIAEKSKDFLKQSADWGFKNIWIASTDLQKDPTTQAFYSLSKQRTSPYGFVIRNDAENRIVLIADSFNKNPKIWPEAEIAPPVSETLLHETTHLVSMTDDIIVYDAVHRGFLKRGKDALIDFVSRYHKNFGTASFSRFVQLIADYFRLDGLSRLAVFRNFATDSMLMANYMLSDAEMVGTLLRDVAYGYTYDQPLLRPKRAVDEPTQESTPELGSGNILISLSLMSIGEYATEERSIGLEVTKEPPLVSTLSDVSPTTEFSTSINSKQAASASVIDAKIPNSQSQNGEIPSQQTRVKRSDLNVSEEKINQGTSRSRSVVQTGTSAEISQSVSTNPTFYDNLSALINRGVGKSQALNRTSIRRRNRKKLIGVNLQN